MNEEEKEAIKELEEFIKGSCETCKYCEAAYKLNRKNIRQLLNLTQKLQKENEELENKIMDKDLEIIGTEEYTKASMGEIIEQYYTVNEDCVLKQKIKDKIEEYGVKLKRCKEENYSTMEEIILQVQIKALEELLRK